MKNINLFIISLLLTIASLASWFIYFFNFYFEDLTKYYYKINLEFCREKMKNYLRKSDFDYDGVDIIQKNKNIILKFSNTGLELKI